MLLAVTGMRREARIAASEAVTALCGGGDRTFLESAIGAALDGSLRGVISFGIAGALASELVPGDIVVASQIVDCGSSYSCDEAWFTAIAAKLPDARVGRIAGSDAILADAGQKAFLHERSGALAADMESHVAARAAQKRGVRFVAIRAISDGAGRALPPAALAALKPGGGIDLPAVLRSIARRPSQIPSLIQTAQETEKAFAALLRCRDMLGSLFALPDFV